MALNIFEELDLTSSGDNVDEGFLKCKNNWAAWDTELNNARDGEATLIAKIDTTTNITSLVGYKSRSVFGYVDANTITVSGGSYEVNGIMTTIAGSITTTAHGEVGGDWVYLYIDYSSIPSGGVLVQADLIWSTTEPAWSDSNVGWYNGNDRCIFAVHITANAIDKFYHNGDLIMWDQVLSIDTGNVPQSFTDIGDDFEMPNFSRNALATFSYSYADADAYLAWRTNGSSASDGHFVGHVDSDSQESFVQAIVTVDSNLLIEIEDDVVSANAYTLYQDGFYLPEGI